MISLFAIILQVFPMVLLLPTHVHASEACTEPVQVFRTGHGRPPGSTLIYVSLRQQVKNAENLYVNADSNALITSIKGDRAFVRILLENHALYDVGSVVFTSSFLPSSELVSVTDIEGAVYDSSRDEFIVERIPSGEEVDVTFTLLLTQQSRDVLHQNIVTLRDFSVLEAERRFQQRLPESGSDVSRQTVERVGIGGMDSACFFRIVDRAAVDTESQAGRVPLTTGQSDTPSDAAKMLLATNPVNVRLNASAMELSPGSAQTYTVTVENTSDSPLHELVVDSRFPGEGTNVIDAGGGEKLEAGIQWFIPELLPGDRWTARYRIQLGEDSGSAKGFPTTVRVLSDELLGTPSGLRTAFMTIPIIRVLPLTGAPVLAVGLLLELLALVLLAAIYVPLIARFRGIPLRGNFVRRMIIGEVL